MKNLTFSSPFVAQETVNLLNFSAFIIPPGIFTLWLYVFETQMLSKLLKSYRNDLVTISKMLICLLMTPLCLLNFPGSKLQLSF